jgi:hypothetical protein
MSKQTDKATQDTCNKLGCIEEKIYYIGQMYFSLNATAENPIKTALSDWLRYQIQRFPKARATKLAVIENFLFVKDGFLKKFSNATALFDYSCAISKQWQMYFSLLFAVS